MLGAGERWTGGHASLLFRHSCATGRWPTPSRWETGWYMLDSREPVLSLLSCSNPQRRRRTSPPASTAHAQWGLRACGAAYQVITPKPAALPLDLVHLSSSFLGNRGNAVAGTAIRDVYDLGVSARYRQKVQEGGPTQGPPSVVARAQTVVMNSPAASFRGKWLSGRHFSTGSGSNHDALSSVIRHNCVVSRTGSAAGAVLGRSSLTAPCVISRTAEPCRFTCAL